MKVELKDAKVELEVGDGKASLHINGHCIELPKVMGIRLIFGDDVVPTPEVKAKPATPTPDMKEEVRRGCQSPSSKRKLSASLKKYHAKKRRKEKAAQLAKPISKQVTTKKTTSGKSNGKYLNGSSTHHVN